MNPTVQTHAKQFVQGQWHYNPEQHSLIKTFATNHQLAELNLLDEDHYLLPELKEAMMAQLGDSFLTGLEGAFGDEDIFSGDVDDDQQTVHYNIELYKVNEAKLEQLKQALDVTIDYVS